MLWLIAWHQKESDSFLSLTSIGVNIAQKFAGAKIALVPRSKSRRAEGEQPAEPPGHGRAGPEQHQKMQEGRSSSQRPDTSPGKTRALGLEFVRVILLMTSLTKPIRQTTSKAEDTNLPGLKYKVA